MSRRTLLAAAIAAEPPARPSRRGGSAHVAAAEPPARPSRRRSRALLAAAAAALAVTAAGCGSVTTRALSHAAPPPPPGLATSLVTPGGTWAVAVLGGSAAQHDNFWQLFLRPAGSMAWRLVTPPGVASNGGLVMAAPGGPSLIVGFRPSQDLAFSPLATTSDNGSRWSSGVLDAGLADVPDALAAAPGGGRFLALLAGRRIDQARDGAAPWSPLASLRALAAAPAARRCSPDALTAVSFAPSGDPLAAASCARPGTAGIFSYAAGTWHAAGPVMPAPLARRRIQVLRLTGTTSGEVALLAARSGRSADVLAAWTRDGTHWTVSGPLNAGTSMVRASGFAAGAAWVLLASGQADTISGRSAAWRRLPAPPAATGALAFGPAGSVNALAARGSRLADWRLGRGARTWRQAQVLDVPVQYGSSG